MTFFLSALTVLFIGLKMTGYIAWSWWYVLLPLYGGLAISVFAIVLCLCIVGFADYFKDRRLK